MVFIQDSSLDNEQLEDVVDHLEGSRNMLYTAAAVSVAVGGVAAGLGALPGQLFGDTNFLGDLYGTELPLTADQVMYGVALVVAKPFALTTGIFGGIRHLQVRSYNNILKRRQESYESPNA